MDGITLAKRFLPRWLPAVVAHATTGRNQMDLMDESSDGSARRRFIGIYLDFLYHLAKARVVGSNPVVRSKKAR